MEDRVMLDSFGTVINTLGKPYLTQIVSTIFWHLNNPQSVSSQLI